MRCTGSSILFPLSSGNLSGNNLENRYRIASNIRATLIGKNVLQGRSKLFSIRAAHIVGGKLFYVNATSL